MKMTPAPPTANPLGALPPSDSRQFRLDALDWHKILRAFLVQVIGLLITLAPTLAHFRYVFHGHDFTVLVLLVVSQGVEAGRRFCTGPEVPPWKASQ